MAGGVGPGAPAAAAGGSGRAGCADSLDENFWSLLKRGLRGTCVAVEPFHLDRSVTEQVFRYNHRATKDNPLNDADRFAVAVSQIVGRRLMYSELTGKDRGTSEHPL